MSWPKGDVDTGGMCDSWWLTAAGLFLLGVALAVVKVGVWLAELAESRTAVLAALEQAVTEHPAGKHLDWLVRDAAEHDLYRLTSGPNPLVSDQVRSPAPDSHNDKPPGDPA